MATSLGFDSVTSCAAARAGITRPFMLDYWVEDVDALESVPVVARTMGWYTEGFAELGRLVRLGQPAIADLVHTSSLTPNELARAAWVVNLADGAVEAEALRVEAETLPESARETARPPYEALQPWIEERLMGSLLAELPEQAQSPHSKILFKGAAGAAVALAEASRVLSEGRVPMCIVGGIDSLADLRWLDAYHALGLLGTPVDPAGVVVGEGAAFLCVETVRAAEARGASILAVLGAPAVGRDPADRFDETPPVGHMLSSVVRSTLGPEAQREPYCLAGLSGDARSAGEWGRAWVRLQPDVVFSDVMYPATAFGDTGAASGFVAAGVALHAFARRTTSSTSAVIWSASDDGLRGAYSLLAAS